MSYKKPFLKSYSAKDIIEEIGPCQNQYTTTTFYTATGNSNVNVDGWVIFSGLVDTGQGVSAGDADSNVSIRGFAGFDISSIQGKTILSATLRFYQVSAAMIGAPYVDLGSVIVDHVTFGSSLDVSDHSGGTLTGNIGTISTNATTEFKTLDVIGFVQADINAGRTSSQYRTRFTTDTNSDNGQDSNGFEDAENSGSTGNRPELVVTYR